MGEPAHVGSGNNWEQHVWQDDEGPVECLTPLETTRVELSYVEVAYSRWHDGGPALVVTSIRCLE